MARMIRRTSSGTGTSDAIRPRGEAGNLNHSDWLTILYPILTSVDFWGHRPLCPLIPGRSESSDQSHDERGRSRDARHDDRYWSEWIHPDEVDRELVLADGDSNIVRPCTRELIRPHDDLGPRRVRRVQVVVHVRIIAAQKSAA